MPAPKWASLLILEDDTRLINEFQAIFRTFYSHSLSLACPLTVVSFTTIDPQRAIGYLQVPCACARYNVTHRCKPNYGSCVQGQRSVPIELLDVAGLVPGAHEGKGLGNKFLDDLRSIYRKGQIHLMEQY